MKAYPLELRQRIVAAADHDGASLPRVAARFRVSINCVANYLRLRAETGSLRPRPNPGGRPPAIAPERHDELRQLLAEQPDLTLEQIRDRLHLDCSLAAVSRTLSKLDLTRKKKVLVAAERQRPDVRQQRDDWAEWQATLTAADLERLVFWDETWVITAMTPTYGRAPAGVRVTESVPHGRWERLTVTAGLRLSGVCAALVFDGAATVEACEAFAQQSLGPELRPGDTVIMDNLSSHHHPDVIGAIEGCGARVRLLPPYSPDFNPIEAAFSKVKAAVRRARARTTEGLIGAVGSALLAITPQDIQGWFQHCGYHTES